MVEAGPARRTIAGLCAVGLITLFVTHPSDALALAGAPGAGPSTAVAGPLLGPEHPVSDPLESPSPVDAADPAVAFDGTNHLVVWRDARAHAGTSGRSIYASRVTPSGVVLDLGGIAIAIGNSDEQQPSVAFGDGVFLVVWMLDGQVVGTRVSPSGQVLDRTPIVLSSSPTSRQSPVVAFGDHRFLVVWAYDCCDPISSEIFGVRVNAAGDVLDPEAIPLSVGSEGAFFPDVSYGAGRFLVVFAVNVFRPEDADVAAVVVDAVSGRPGERIVVSAAPGSQGRPAVAFNGANHLVVWTDAWSETGYALLGSRVDPAGVVLDPAGITISGAAPGWPQGPNVAATGGTFLVAWNESNGFPGDLDGARVDATGAVLDVSPFVISASIASGGVPPAMSPSSAGFFVAWPDARYGATHVLGESVGVDGSVHGAGWLIDRTSNDQSGSAIAFDGTNHLVVWTDTRGTGRTQVLGGRVSPSGRFLDGSDLQISAGGPGEEPEVTFDGRNYLVVWRQPWGPMWATTVSTDGSVGTPIQLPTAFFAAPPEVASNGTDFLVVWQEDEQHPGTTDRVAAARISRDGVLLDEVAIEIARPQPVGGVAVASDGRDFLVTWSDDQRIVGSRLSGDGRVLDPERFAISSGGATEPAVAWNGRRYLVAWTVSGASGQDVAGARVTGDGTVQDPAGIAISGAPGNERTPVVAANGPFLVAWREDRTGRDGVHGTRVDDTGAVLDTPSLQLTDPSRDGHWPGLSAGPDGTWGLTYTRFVPEPRYGSNRVFLRSVAPK